MLDHLGVEVDSADDVTSAAGRLAAEGLATLEEQDTACCYAVQDKVWVTGPGQEPWELYVVKGDAANLGRQEDSACCRGPEAVQDLADPAVRPAASPSCC